MSALKPICPVSPTAFYTRRCQATLSKGHIIAYRHAGCTEKANVILKSWAAMNRQLQWKSSPSRLYFKRVCAFHSIYSLCVWYVMLLISCLHNTMSAGLNIRFANDKSVFINFVQCIIETNLSNQSFSKLDLCEGGSFSTAIFNSGPFYVLYPFVRLSLLKATYAENLHIVLSSRY